MPCYADSYYRASRPNNDAEMIAMANRLVRQADEDVRKLARLGYSVSSPVYQEAMERRRHAYNQRNQL